MRISILVFLILLGCFGCKQNETVKTVKTEVIKTPKTSEAIQKPIQKPIQKAYGVQFVEKAKTYLDLRETEGENRSPRIDKFHDYAKLPYGNPWCMMFVNYVQKEVLEPELEPYTRTARVATFYHLALKNKYNFKIKFAKGLMYGVSQAEAGDILIFIQGVNKKPFDNFNGHTGFVVKEISPGKFETIEGNTGPGPSGSQRDGDGVYIRNRSIRLHSGFRIDALIQPIYGENHD